MPAAHDEQPSTISSPAQVGVGGSVRVARNTVLNLVGLGGPLLVAVVTIPRLLDALGDERFGLLTLVWAVVSYIGLFDLGLGRALTQQLATTFARDAHASVMPLVSTASTLMGVLGVIAGLLLGMTSTWLVQQLQEVSDRGEAVAAVRAMAWAVPFIVLTSGLRGILEARAQFLVINFIRLPLGLFTFLGPLAVVASGPPDLVVIAWVLTGGRIAAFLAHLVFARRALGPAEGAPSFDATLVRPLLVAGGWMTLASVVSPLMGYVDRFAIAITVSASAVTYYATPHEMNTKLWIVPGALTAVLFPRFAHHLARDSAAAWPLFKRAVTALLVALLPVTLAVGLFAREILTLWIGAEFASQSAPLLRLFAAGILINCLAHVPFTLLQGTGHARTTAIIQCIELPALVVVLGLATARYGLMGAAVTWLLRVLVDAVVMFYFGVGCLERRFVELVPWRQLLAGSALVFAAFGTMLLGAEVRAAVVLIALIPGAWVLARQVKGRPVFSG